MPRVVLLVMPLLLVTLACAATTVATQAWTGPMPRIVCPTPTPLPTVEYDILVPTVNALGTPTVTVERYRTAPYEREYGSPVTPTTYARTDTIYRLGDIVDLGSGRSVQLTLGTPIRDATVQRIPIRVDVVTPSPWPIVPVAQIGVSTLRRPSGSEIAGFWPVTAPPLPDDPDRDGIVIIPAGRSAWVWDVRLDAAAGTPTAVELRLTWSPDSRDSTLRLTWVDTAPMPDPYCPVEHWHGVWTTAPDSPTLAVIPPTGISATRATVVQTALSLLGRPYCFGGKGWNRCPAQCFGATCYPGCASPPCYDCSGLAHAAWASAGIDIGHGSMNQAQRVTRRDLAALQPGDLLFFWSRTAHRRVIGHVAVYAGDLNGDGEGDLIHASWYDRPSHIVFSWQRTDLWSRFAFGGSPITDR